MNAEDQNRIERERLEQELLELHFDCHPDPDALRARLESEPELRALKQRVLRTAGLLEAAAREPVPELELSAPPARRRRRMFDPSRGAGRLTLGAAAAVLIAAGFLAHWGARAWHEASVRGDGVRVVVEAPAAVPDGAPLAFSVRALHLDDSPAGTTVSWVAFDADGGEISRDRAPVQGARTFTLPTSLLGARRLVVTADTPEGEQRAEFALDPGAAAPLVHLSTDKPIYRPGESVFVRAVALNRLTLEPLATGVEAEVRILDPKDNAVLTTTFRPAQAEHGAAGIVWSIPENLAGGRYTVELRQTDGELPRETAEFVVRRFQAPRLAKEITLDRETYAPGSAGTAEIVVGRMGEGPAAGASVTTMLVIDGGEVWREDGALDANGRLRVQFAVPSEVERGAARLVARVTDGGVVETVVEPFVVPTGRVEVALYAEGGSLVAGVASRVYAEIRDPLDRPISARGRVVDENGTEVARFATEHQGRGRIELVPRANAAYRLELDEPVAGAHPLPAVADHGVALRALSDRFGPGEPVRVRVHAPDGEQLVIAAFCRGALVAQESVTGQGPHDVALRIRDQASGVLRVTVFDARLRPLAERLVQRLPKRRIDVAIEPDTAVTAPADRQTLRIVARDETGRAAAGAVLGVVVTDDAVRSLAGEPRVGLFEQALLFGDVGPLEDRATFLTGAKDAALHVDLLLGTRGWRRFVWVGDADTKSRIAALGDWTEPIAAKSGWSDRSTTVDGEERLRATIAAAAGEAQSAKDLALSAVVLAVLGLILLLVAEGAIALARRLKVTRHWSGDLLTGLVGAGAAVVLAGLSVSWLGAGNALMRALPAPVVEKLAAAVPYIRDFDVQVANEPLAFAPDDRVVLFDERAANERFLRMPEFAGLDPADNGIADRGEGVALEGLLAEMDEIVEEEKEVDNDFKNAFGAWRVLAKDKFEAVRFIRVYAHQNRGGRARSDFTETLYWNPLLVTDAEGRARVSFEISDKITTWSAHADAHGGGRLGGGEARFDSRIPFFVEAKLPIEATDGDELELPVALIAQDPRLAAAEVRVGLSGGLTSEAPGPKRAELTEGRGRVLVPVRIGSGGAATIALTGAAGRFRDSVRQELRVVPRGFPHRRSWAGQLTAEQAAELTLAVPEALVDGSATAVLQIFPSPLSTLREGLSGILREPGGCFEQASSSNYPNLLVLDYLEASGDDLPSAAAEARRLLPRGYQLIAGYECSDRGYEWFGSNPGHEALTAYGLMEFRDMARVYDVDLDMVERTRRWLLGRRTGSGGYARDPKALDSFGRAPQQVTDAYITYALLYAGEKAEDLSVEVDALEQRAVATDDGYELALCAGALALAGRDAAASGARERLAALQQDDGHVPGTTTSITSSGGDDLLVETTSFAILAWLGDERFAANARLAVEFVQSKQRSRGTFGATQATILALKALTAHAQNARRLPEDGKVRVLVGGVVALEREFTKGQAEPIVVDLLPLLAAGANDVRVELIGGGEDAALPWACGLGYHDERPADDPGAKVAVRASLAAEQVREGETVALDVEVSNRTADGVPMALAIVGLPAGLEAQTAVLDDLKESGAIDLWEIRGRELVFYWRGLAPEQKRTLQVDLVARIPGRSTGPASRAYLYYTPDAVRWAAPIEVSVTAR